MTYSMSTPSRLCSFTKLMMALANMVRFSAEPTELEKYLEPVQPPSVIIASTFYNTSR